MADRYRVVSEGKYFKVVDARGVQQGHLSANVYKAQEKAEALNRKAKQTIRVCMAHGCTTKFTSDGPHHRLCNFHRAYGDNSGAYMSTGTRRARFRSS
jgi:uncharacterized protein YcgI (DUF1989 family)